MKRLGLVGLICLPVVVWGAGWAVGLWFGVWPPAPGSPRDRALAPFETPPTRIVAFGTSLTASNGWPDRLAGALSDCFGQAVQVIRVAKSGMGSTWALEQVAQVAAARPDVVLIEFAINDADLRDGVARRRGRAQHAALVAALRQAVPEARLVLMTMSPATGARGLVRAWLAGHYRDVVALGAAEGLAVVDLYTRWRQSPLPPPRDGLHPDDAATEAVIDPALIAAFGAATDGACAG